MTTFRILIFFFFPICSWAQIETEIKEVSGKVLSLEPGVNFALEYLVMEVDGVQQTFSFLPNYGELLRQKIRIGEMSTVRVEVNIKTKERINQQLKEAGANGKTFRFFYFDRLKEIKSNDKWIEIAKPITTLNRNGYYEVFLEKKIKGIYTSQFSEQALVFENGLVAFNRNWFSGSRTARETKQFKEGDIISFTGWKNILMEGFVYPIDGVNEVFSYNLLIREPARLQTYLFKQNYACIGAKFKTNDGKELMVSFPTDNATDVKKFLQPDQDLMVYYGPKYQTGNKFDLPELHAVIQGKDTLFIKEFGFFGAPDGVHEHVKTELKGKITRINKSERGNVISIIVGSEYYIEIDAMMAQQLGLMFQKGKEIVVQGKERVKRSGEIYSKNYRIITPEEIIIDEKTFSAYHP